MMSTQTSLLIRMIGSWRRALQKMECGEFRTANVLIFLSQRYDLHFQTKSVNRTPTDEI